MVITTRGRVVRQTPGVSILHRIEALAGAGRYAVTFQRDDGAEQTAIVEVTQDRVSAAEASLPPGWTLESDAFLAVAEAVQAVERARGSRSDSASLTDVAGGWDVMMGNVVLNRDGVPACIAHGPMQLRSGWVYLCLECEARALYAASDEP